MSVLSLSLYVHVMDYCKVYVYMRINVYTCVNRMGSDPSFKVQFKGTILVAAEKPDVSGWFQHGVRFYVCNFGFFPISGLKYSSCLIFIA